MVRLAVTRSKLKRRLVEAACAMHGRSSLGKTPWEYVTRASLGLQPHPVNKHIQRPIANFSLPRLYQEAINCTKVATFASNASTAFTNSRSLFNPAINALGS